MMDNLCVVPARSGSKGLKNKNIKELCGFPLLMYSIRAAVDSGLFRNVMVSTDSQEYARISKGYGAEVPFLRSRETSSDSASSWDVVKEVLLRYKERNLFFDTVCLLQPTSPLRKAEDIVNGYDLLFDKAADAVTAVCEVEHSPLWTMALEEDHSLKEYRKKAADIPRQMLRKYYRVNGALYIRKVQYTDDGILLHDDDEYALIMDRKRSIDIDTVEDFELAEWYMGRMDS